MIRDLISSTNIGDEDEANELRKATFTSTPVKSKARRKLVCHFGSVRVDHDARSPRGEKHDLTPGSKEHSGQPKSKRFQVGEPVFCIVLYWYNYFPVLALNKSQRLLKI